MKIFIIITLLHYLTELKVLNKSIIFLDLTITIDIPIIVHMTGKQMFINKGIDLMIT